jgi:hypothetical protein
MSGARTSYDLNQHNDLHNNTDTIPTNPLHLIFNIPPNNDLDNQLNTWTDDASTNNGHNATTIQIRSQSSSFLLVSSGYEYGDRPGQGIQAGHQVPISRARLSSPSSIRSPRDLPEKIQ